MAYMSQENKASKAPKIAAICKRFGVKATLAVRHHSTLVLNISSGPIDFIGNYNEVEAKRNMCKPDHMRDRATTYMSVNDHWYHEHFTGPALKFLEAVIDVMNEGNWDKSDIQTDYFNVGWYLDVNVGRWNKPYVYAPLSVDQHRKLAASRITELQAGA